MPVALSGVMTTSKSHTPSEIDSACLQLPHTDMVSADVFLLAVNDAKLSKKASAAFDASTTAAWRRASACGSAAKKRRTSAASPLTYANASDCAHASGAMRASRSNGCRRRSPTSSTLVKMPLAVLSTTPSSVSSAPSSVKPYSPNVASMTPTTTGTSAALTSSDAPRPNTIRLNAVVHAGMSERNVWWNDSVTRFRLTLLIAMLTVYSTLNSARCTCSCARSARSGGARRSTYTANSAPSAHAAW
mmetsp:Transcript_45757/g.112167  ORF Transcript_45757/g.112167 Transcript_45757/m.112167 type:complete len:246 (+) Transcript_45757:74-811(+)